MPKEGIEKEPSSLGSRFFDYGSVYGLAHKASKPDQLSLHTCVLMPQERRG